MKTESTLLCRLFDYLFELFDTLGSFTYIGIFRLLNLFIWLNVYLLVRNQSVREQSFDQSAVSPSVSSQSSKWQANQ
jgi:hypothetical protein